MLSHETRSAVWRGLFLAVVLQLMLVPAILYWPSFEQNVGKLRSMTPLPVLKQLVTSLEDTSNYVANFLAAVTARVTSKVALKMSYTLEYRGQPIVVVVPGDTPEEPDGLFEYEASDSILSASLVIAF